MIEVWDIITLNYALSQERYVPQYFLEANMNASKCSWDYA